MTAVAHKHDDELGDAQSQRDEVCQHTPSLDQAAAPPADSAEEPMPEDAFAVIQRVHELCGHSPARELTEGEGWNFVGAYKISLVVHATKILGAMIFAGKLVAEMKQRGDFDLDVSETCLVETDCEDSHWCEPSLVEEQALTDGESAKATENIQNSYKHAALAAWHSAGWARAAAEYQFERGKQRGVRQ
jgi:hypothetical protein